MSTISLKTKKQVIYTVEILFALCSIVEYIEFLFVRTEQTIIADNVFTKIFCIIATFAAMKINRIKIQDLGFNNNKVIKYLGCGLGLGILALVFGIGYVILAGVLGIEWGICVNMTGVIWMCVAEHFFNNFIGNILHVVSVTGTDELQIVRIVLSNVLSLIIVIGINTRKGKANSDCTSNEV